MILERVPIDPEFFSPVVQEEKKENHTGNLICAEKSVVDEAVNATKHMVDDLDFMNTRVKTLIEKVKDIENFVLFTKEFSSLQISNTTKKMHCVEKHVESFLTAISPILGAHFLLPTYNRLMYIFDKSSLQVSLDQNSPIGWVIPTRLSNITYTFKRPEYITKIDFNRFPNEVCSIRDVSFSFYNEKGIVMISNSYLIEKGSMKGVSIRLPVAVRCIGVKIMVHSNWGDSRCTCFSGVNFFGLVL